MPSNIPCPYGDRFRLEVSQTSNEFLIPLEIGDYDYVITWN